MELRLGCQTNAWATLDEALPPILALGFSGFETGFRNILPLGESILGKGNLTCLGVHIFLQEYDPQTYLPPLSLAMEVATKAHALGAESLIVSGAPAPHGQASHKARGLNAIAEAIQGLGLRLSYHNHAPELNSEIDVLLAETDPAFVSLLLDAGHAFRAGVDVVEFAVRRANRIAGIHLRDFKGGKQVPLGQGEFPVREFADALRSVKWKGWVIAEEEREDGSKLGLHAIEPARHALREAFGI
jgi:inosose dehydratase